MSYSKYDPVIEEVSNNQTHDEYDAYGANRWDHVDFYDLDQVEAEASKFMIAQAKQFVGGFVAAAYYTAKGEAMANPPAGNKFEQGNRQKFDSGLTTLINDPRVKASERALDSAKVMQGQNYAQEAQGEPMPKNTIPIFMEQVMGHALLDEKARAKGKKCAPHNIHNDWDIKCHQKHQAAFKRAGFISGPWLHWFGEKKEQLTKEGRFDFPPTCSTDDPLSFHAYTKEDYKRMENSYNSSDSDKEESTVEKSSKPSVEPSVHVSVEPSEKQPEKTEPEDVNVSNYSGSFFSVIAQKEEENDMDYLSRLDSILN